MTPSKSAGFLFLGLTTAGVLSGPAFAANVIITINGSPTTYVCSGVSLDNDSLNFVCAAPAGGGGTPDTQAPTAPAGLTVTPVSSSQLNLSWTAATDDVGVAGYRIERCIGATCTDFTQIAATGSVTNFNNITLSAETTYSYRVRAADAAGNLGPYSDPATGLTNAAAGGGGPTSDPGMFQGTWMPSPTIRHWVVDQSELSGSGTVTAIPGCINQTTMLGLSNCTNIAPFLSSFNGTATSISLMNGGVISIRYRPKATLAGGSQYFQVTGITGGNVGKNTTVSLTTTPGQFPGGVCQSTTDRQPIILISSGCTIQPSTPYYYLNIKVNAACLTDSECRFKILEPANLN